MQADEGMLMAPQNEGPKQTVVASSGQLIASSYRIVRFRGRALIEVLEPYPHFEPLHKDRFEQIAYPLLGGISRSRMNDIFAYLINTAEDLTPYEDFICFGVPGGFQTVWDMKELVIRPDILPDLCVWRSPYEKIPSSPAGYKPIPFVMSLAGGSQDKYDDIMQSLAPIVMHTKPDGVIWWVGSGANGKSTLMDAIYKIFPGHLASINVKRLTDGRDTPSLNGMLANVVKENSEGRIDDTQVYKSIGTHENFRVHKFHSQDDIEIRGNLHHIFSANQIPAFNDKGHSTKRRTHIVRFTETFDSDPSFEERTFTPELFGRLIVEMCSYANRIKRQGYRYKWSAATLSAKADYDAEASNAEEYAKHIISEGIVAFDSFNPLRMDYENWCADNGYVPLGVSNLRRAMTELGFERLTHREDKNTKKIYRLNTVDGKELQPVGMGRPGLYTIPGFEPTKPVEVPKEVTKEPAKPIDTYKDIVKDKW